jgi:IS30 family transposase
VDLKKEIDHWEGDTVHGQDGYLVALTERVSKFILTVRAKNKTRKVVSHAIKKRLRPYQNICKVIRFDNGAKFAGHSNIAQSLECNIKPYHSWQRGFKENANGLLR